MSNAFNFVFVSICILEAVVIIVGNALTFCVFWSQRSRLKGTYYILMNLAVGDFLVGLTETVILARSEKFRETTAPNRSGRENVYGFWQGFQTFSSITSVFFLALISLERVYAVLYPLRHRVANTSAYIYSIIVVWTLGICLAGIIFLKIYYAKVNEIAFVLSTHLSLFIALLITCASYITIRYRLRRTASSSELVEGRIHNQLDVEHSLRLSRTLLVVVAVSLILWLPAFFVYTARVFCLRCIPEPAVWVVKPLHLANSMVNPFVYSFKMTVFKDALKKMWRKRRANIEIVRPVSVELQ